MLEFFFCYTSTEKNIEQKKKSIYFLVLLVGGFAPHQRKHPGSGNFILVLVDLVGTN